MADFAVGDNVLVDFYSHAKNIGSSCYLMLLEEGGAVQRETKPRFMNANAALALACLAILLSASFAAAAQYGLVLNARSTGVIDFNAKWGRC